MNLKRCVVAAFATLLFAAGSPARAQEDPGWGHFHESMAGKRVILIPMAMGFYLSQGWLHYIGNAVKAAGGIFETRDPNWSVDAGAQAITEAIDSKPAVLIVMNPDLQSYVKLFKKAQAAGIYVIQIDNRSNYPTEVFAGSDWVQLGALEAQAAVNACGAGTSQKIILVQGDPANASSLDQLNGIKSVLDKHPEIKIAAEPISNWDVPTARTVTQTALQQHPDACAAIDFWDGTAEGTAAAIRDAKLTGKVSLVTNGGGEQVDCDRLQDGTFGAIVSTELPKQSEDVVSAIEFLLQSAIPAGKEKTWMFTHETITTKANLKPTSCWSLKNIQAEDASH